jgi:hypothetical protein
MRRQSDPGSPDGDPADDDPQRSSATDQRPKPGDVSVDDRR